MGSERYLEDVGGEKEGEREEEKRGRERKRQNNTENTLFHFIRGNSFYYEADMCYFEKVVYPF